MIVPVTAAAQAPSTHSTSPKTVEVSLTAAPARLSIIDGAQTDVYAYNGTVPGPILEITEGERLIVHFKNNLPHTTTIHWHGLHIPWSMDGSPYHPVEPGEQYDYVLEPKPGSAGTYWYHPHPHHGTGDQVARGLYGVIIVRALDDPLPKLTERVLVLSDNRFKPDGSIDISDPRTLQGRIDFENGREGDVFFVNGERSPTLSIRSGEVQRWRIVNASAARVYRLALQGHTFLHVGTDGGLFEHPLEVNEIMLAVGERAEVVVRGSAAPGSKVMLQNLPYDRYIPQTKPKDWERTIDLFTLQYTTQKRLASRALPKTLRVVPALDTMQVSAVREIALSQGLINGKLHDMERIDVASLLGKTEIWRLENIVGMDHPFHLHGFQFQLLDRNGVPEKQRQWKDVVNVPKHETARFIVRYDNYPGKWMFHCHILDHEDHGMMGVLGVTLH